MDLNYNELYEKCRILEGENKRLKDEIELLRKVLANEGSEAYSSVDFTMIKETHLYQDRNLVTRDFANKNLLEG